MSTTFLKHSLAPAVSIHFAHAPRACSVTRISMRVPAKHVGKEGP